ncbi:MAG: hypothetical protein JST68_01995 [Bacteroidetes bacterium]|nr:hypothetical protein [Bacteroidota bacterium]
MNQSFKNNAWLAACGISYFLVVWMCMVNIQEIMDRASGNFTYFSQRTYLADKQSIIYLGVWTVVLVLLSIFSLRCLIKKRVARAGIYAVILIFLVGISMYVDTLFYDPLV